MAREHEIDARATSAASPEAVWALLADTASWPTWSGVDEAHRTKDGAPDPEGVGANRVFITSKVRNEEEIVRFEPGRALGYRVIGGTLPIRDYRSEVTLTPAGSGTEIRWHSLFKAKYPGTGGLVRRRLGDFIQQSADRLARAAEASAPGAQTAETAPPAGA